MTDLKGTGEVGSLSNLHVRADRHEAVADLHTSTPSRNTCRFLLKPPLSECLLIFDLLTDTFLNQDNSMAKRKSDAINGRLVESGAPSLTNGVDSAKRSKTNEGPAPSPRSDIVDEANALDSQQFTNRFLDRSSTRYKTAFDVSECNLTFAKDLPSHELQQCFNLIETTSRKDYEASGWGWHPKRKKREMKEQEMRYLTVRRSSWGADKQERHDSNFQGFLSFMLTHDSTPAMPVLYIYEIHLSKEVRGKGLGLHLLKTAEAIARKTGVKKVMLTSFLSNTNALSFYQKHGFRTDACSPGDRRTRNKVVKADYVIMSKEVDSMKAAEATNANAVQVMEEEPTESLISDRTDEFPSLDDCPGIMRAWIDGLKQQELLDLGLSEAEKARHLLSSDQDEEAAKHRDILSALFQCLQTRYEAARDLDEILREQMYHLKSHISDVDRMAETLTAPTQCTKRKLSPQLNEESFDWDKATEQVYSAFYTLLRKAEEVDNRLDTLVEREQEADQREDDLDGREEELDSWENDIHEREKALADREERLMRSKRRLSGMKRRKGSGSRFTEELYYQEAQDVWEGEPVRALPWRQEAPPPNKVDLWLHQTSACDEIDIDPGD